MSRRLLVLAAVIMAIAVIGAAAAVVLSGGDDDPAADQRAEQVRAAAIEAGLSEEVADVLALAARGSTATFQVSYPGADGAGITVSQDPPNRRVDVLTAGLIVESQVQRGEVGYLCSLPQGGAPGDALECSRRTGVASGPGTFTADALDAFTEELAGALDALDISVEDREVAGVKATCLVTAPEAGRVIDGDSPGVDTICLAPDGAQLLVDVDGERVVANDYSPTVPDGTFDVVS